MDFLERENGSAEPEAATKQEYKALFDSMHPGFFEREHIRGIPDGEVYEEMVLRLEEFDPEIYRKEFGSEISFGFYEGELAELKALVGKVEEGWVPLYDGKERVYCGFIDGKVASFCIVEDMGTHELNGQKFKFGGPGCVGTLPEYRDRGIGLTMVRKVTELFKAEGYDYSYIHYTGVASWYAKLGYRTCAWWTGKGIV